MATTIFFDDLRDPNGIDHVFIRCLLFKQNDTLLIATLPDGERFFAPKGDSPPLNTTFMAPSDVNTPIKVVVRVGNPDWAGADNRASCEQRIVPDGSTLTFDGERFEVI